MSSVQGVVVRGMKISNCGGEGILVRYFATNCKIYKCKIVWTGCFDFKFEGNRGIKNGEGICEYWCLVSRLMDALGGLDKPGQPLLLRGGWRGRVVAGSSG